LRAVERVYERTLYDELHWAAFRFIAGIRVMGVQGQKLVGIYSSGRCTGLLLEVYERLDQSKTNCHLSDHVQNGLV
jgi:hypothetical protein